jgi:glucokinase
MAELRLIADVGGTNARFAVAEKGQYSQVKRIEVSHYATIQAAVSEYLKGLPGDLRPTIGVIDIAGPVSGDQVKLTNQNWSFSTAALRDELGFTQLVVVNDFVGAAMAVPFLPQADLYLVGPAQPSARGAIGVVGPGTGLGMSTLVPNAGGWMLLPGEGGHVTMSPATQEEGRILDFLRERFPHVSAERVLSGAGIVNLYNALCALQGKAPSPLSPAEVTQRATLKTDPVCVEAFSHFCAMLGTVAGNLALTVGATGGIYIAGGILPRFKEAFANSLFRERFEAKGRLQDYVKKVPSYLILEESPALLGLANLPLNN